MQPEPGAVHVCTPRRRQSLDEVQVHWQRQGKVKRLLHKHLPVTPAELTLLHIAPEVSFYQLRRAVAEAEFLKLVTLDQVGAVLGSGKPGSAALRAALECHRPQLARTRKGLEEKFLLLVEGHSLPIPDVNVSIAGWLVDAVWFGLKIVVELDSHLAHGTRTKLERDHRRDLELRAAGYTVLRYTWQQVTETPELVMTDLARHGIRPTA